MHCILPDTAPLFTRMHFATNNSNKNTRKFGIVRCSDSEFSLWQIFFSTVRDLTKFEIRSSGIFQISTTVNLEIGLTRPGVKVDEKMSICCQTLQHGDILPANCSLLEGDAKVRKCRAMLFLRTCMSRKWM